MLRGTFDSAAQLYHQARPDYPGALYDELIRLAGLRPGDRLLAWHWIDPSVKYERARDLLRRGGHLAFWSATHAVPVGGDTFFRDIQPVYDEIGESLPASTCFPEPGQLPDSAAEILASGLFEDVQLRQFDWESRYDADGYIRLLGTFSGHLAMADWQRDRLYGEIRRRLAGRPDGILRRHWGAVLHLARRAEHASWPSG
jgi:hypothetical protein